MNQDFADLFKILNEEKVEFIVVGAHAVMFYSEPRYTKDLDVWVNPSSKNSKLVYKALKKFGAPLDGVSTKDFQNKKMIYQIGVAPNRIDILMGIDGVEFKEAWSNRVGSRYGEIPIHLLGRRELIVNKKASGRPQDKLDLKKIL